MNGTLWGAAAAVLLFGFFQVCGLCAARFALRGESCGVQLLMGSLCGSVMLQWLPIPFAFFLGFSVPAHLCGALLAAGCAGACFLYEKGESGRLLCADTLLAFRRQKFLVVPALMCLFFGFLTAHSFLWKDGRVYSSQATYGDMSMHLSFLTSLARQGTFPPHYSLLPGARLSYPFLSDSISASLYLFGAPLQLAYLLPMFFAGAQVFFGFYLFAARLLKSRGKAAAAWLLFFFNGGLGFVYFFNGEKTMDELLHGFYQTPTNLTEKEIRWVNVVVDMMLPQRATLFGWAVLFPLLYLLYRAVFEGKKKYFLYAGVLGGLLPMIHTHSLLALALICGCWLLFSLLRDAGLERRSVWIGKGMILAGLPCMALLYPVLTQTEKPALLLWAAAVIFGAAAALVLWLVIRNISRHGWRELASTWGVLLLAVCVLALPQLFTWTFRQAGEGDFVRGHFGWIISQGEDGYRLFYAKNLGLAALLALGGLLTAGDRAFAEYSPALAIWLLAELVEFQPNDYDNNKLLYVAFAFLCCAGAEFFGMLLKKLKRRGLQAAAAAVAAVLCMSAAVLTMCRESVAQYELFGEGAMSLCRYVEENVAPEAIVLTDTRHNNEIAALTGRNVVCGSPSYLFFHGLPYGKSEWAAQQMYETPRECREMFDEFGVDYVLVSDFERYAYEVDNAALEEMFSIAYRDDGRVLYRVER